MTLRSGNVDGERAVTRNSIVALLGTPDAVEGSLNDPVEREEFGIRYNEKWIYRDLSHDPAGVSNRAVYWHRYDFVATMVRNSEQEQWRPDSKLVEAAKALDARKMVVDDHHTSHPVTGHYHAVSTPQDWRDLGGYIQDEFGRRISKAEP
jgi:hypothetical protein